MNTNKDTKNCARCKYAVCVSLFSKNKSNKFGLDTYCKPCKRAQGKIQRANNSGKRREQYLSNKEAILKRQAEYYIKNRESIIKKTSAYQKTNRGKKVAYDKKRNLRIMYGLTLDQYTNILVEQNYSCAICKTKEQRLVVDHIHGSDPVKVRGILCANCNLGIGILKDNCEIIMRAADYVKKYK